MFYRVVVLLFFGLLVIPLVASPPPAAPQGPSAYEHSLPTPNELPVVAEYHYRLSGSARPFLFWITRDNVGSGRMTWRGRVDDDVRIKIRGGSADVETIGGSPYYDAQPNFSNSLPNRRVTVRLTEKRGRGDIFIEQQPTRENDFTAIVRIKDPKGGASDYAFTLEW